MARRSAFTFLAAALVLGLTAGGTAFAQPAQPKNPSFNLINKADKPIRELYATPAGLENWGQNRLEGKTIAAGATFPVRLRADGNCVFDLRVVFTDGKNEDRKRVDTCKVDDIAVGAPATGATGGAAAGSTPAGSHDASFRLINRGKSPITEVYATPSPAVKVGDNLLTGGAVLAPEASRIFRMPPGSPCAYDLRVVFADKQSREKKGADLCKISDLPVQ